MIRYLVSFGTGTGILRTLALAATIGATVFLLWQSDEPERPRAGAEQLRGPSEPDSFVVGGRYRSWNDQGNLEIRLTSPRIEQFEATSLATLETPWAQVYNASDAEPWIISADTGSLQQAEGILDLKGDVEVERSANGGTTTLNTQALTLDNNTDTVFTDQPVTITEPFGVTRAVGMKGWIDQRILELNSRVEGQYETSR
ncbi:LPS export ABC transporter periplasmic protein LptC [Marinobacter oulmenensis]|uniref:Lipopolysaccharide export system protein LptC n=1 Tax=Marinobacter oulmenensis TaxID=643747 RepID=A0A840UNA2_9GAMM|nr:LPS export ABC transporter periplasmic protein LptC [Marinobacter oulmenensis]MBB5322128.1 lipopolysaccharide export system protein LptC [Marinobacter oulmenensis]